MCYCSPLTRQDLVSWKLALDRRPLPALDKEVRGNSHMLREMI